MVQCYPRRPESGAGVHSGLPGTGRHGRRHAAGCRTSARRPAEPSEAALHPPAPRRAGVHRTVCARRCRSTLPPSVRPSVRPSVCLSACPSVRPSVRPSSHPPPPLALRASAAPHPLELTLHSLLPHALVPRRADRLPSPGSSTTNEPKQAVAGARSISLPSPRLHATLVERAGGHPAFWLLGNNISAHSLLRATLAARVRGMHVCRCTRTRPRTRTRAPSLSLGMLP